jgi:hypothetical protein
MRLDLKQLSECPEHLTAVGTWIYDQWWSRSHQSPEVVFALLRAHSVRDRVPFTTVALADGTPVGSCSVIGTTASTVRTTHLGSQRYS